MNTGTLKYFNQALARMAEPCPKTESGAEPQAEPTKAHAKASDWAKEKLNFQPEPKQVEVLDSTAKYLILCCNRQWGKTTTIAIKALHYALHTLDKTIVILSRTKAQAAILVNRMTTFMLRLRLKIRRVMGFPFSIQLPNGSNIIAVAHSGDTSVGNSAKMVIPLSHWAVIRETRPKA